MSLAFAVGYLALARSRGAFGASRNDDWSYLRVAFGLAANGRFHLNGWVQMSFVGQAVLALPVLLAKPENIRALQVMVALLGAAAVTMSFVVLRSFLRPRWAALACLVLLVGPVFGSLSVSFMTDIPMYAFTVLTLLLGWRAVAPDRVAVRCLVASAAAGFFAMSIREFGAIAFGAVVVVALLRASAVGDRRRLAAIGAVSAAFCLFGLAGYAWLHSLPNTVPVIIGFRADQIFKVPSGAFTLALFISPCPLAVSPRRLADAAWRISRPTAVTGLVLSIVIIVTADHARFLGNYFSGATSYPEATAGHKVVVVPTMLYLAARIVAAYAVVILVQLVLLAGYSLMVKARARGAWHALQAVCSSNGAAALLTVFLGALVAAHVVTLAVLNAPLWDRYLIVFVPFVGGLALLVAERFKLLAAGPALAVAAAGIGCLALLGLLVVDASAAVDGAKWTLAERALAKGYDPGNVDGGFEWWGLHQPGSAQPHPPAPDRSWYTAYFAPRTICAAVTMAPNPPGAGDPPPLDMIKRRTILGTPIYVMLDNGPDDCQTAANSTPSS